MVPQIPLPAIMSQEWFRSNVLVEVGEITGGVGYGASL